MKNVGLKYIRYIYKYKTTNEIIYCNRKTV